MALPATWTARLQDWHPRSHGDRMPEDHMKEMYSIGEPSSKLYYFNPVITAASAGLLWGFVIWAMVEQEDAVTNAQEWQAWVTDVWNWLYMVSQNFWIVALLYVLYKYYDLPLGDGKPEFSNATYFAMLFSCGVATGLFYFSAEAMWHYENYGGPRWQDKLMWNDNTRAEHSMMVTFFHWGLHGWIPYTTVGALISIMSYRRKFPMSMRFTLYPLIGEMCYGILGDLVEVLSILCTVFGVCTSLGLGAMQINKGLVRLDRGTYLGKDTIGCASPTDLKCDGRIGLSENSSIQILIILGITLLATASVVAGLKRGIAALSQFAFALSLLLLMSILFMDETWYILNALSSTFGYYLWYLPKISFHTDAWEELGPSQDGLGGAPDDRGGLAGWMNGWTIFYWGWWISWAPFVGTFLARISRGRKLGEFIIATLILPSIWSCIFLGVFGAAQIRMVNQAKSAGLKGWSADLCYGNLANKSMIGYNQAINKTHTTWVPVADTTTYLYCLATEDVLFEHLCSYGGEGWGTFITVIVLICIILYFVTSSDSASFVVDIMAANGVEEPPLLQKIFWAFTEGASASALLASASDDSPQAALNAVKALPIILGLPFTFLLFWMCQGLVIVCKEEAGDLNIERKHFKTFLFNLETFSFISFVAPFMGCGEIAVRLNKLTPPTEGEEGKEAKEPNKVLYMIGYACIWVTMIILLFIGIADNAFAQMGAAMYFMFGLAVAGLRVASRKALGISGDMISDIMACWFAMPFAIGQMYAEDYSARAAADPDEAPKEPPKTEVQL